MSLGQKLVHVLGAVGLGTALLAGPALAQDADNIVTLKSFDGFTQLRGELVDFDGQTFTLKSSLGTIKIDALRVNCEGAACPEDLLFGAEFGIVGSNTIGAVLMPALIEGYAESLDADVVREIGPVAEERTMRIRHADGREMAAIELKSRSSSNAFTALAATEADIGMSSRAIRRADVATLVQAGMPDPRDSELERVLALDGLIAIVHPDNPISSISIEELSLIFSGEVANWSQLGGADLPINIYALDDASGTFSTFSDLVLAPTGAVITPNAKRFESNAQLSDSVARDTAGIGFTGLAFQRATKALPIRQACGMLSPPTAFSVKTEEYPLARRLYLYLKPEDMTAHARQLVDFAMSPDAQPLIEDNGFINSTIETVHLNDQGARIVHALSAEEEFSAPLMREMMLELRDAGRMSLTFRFSPGSAGLTPKSQADAERFARDLASGLYNDRDVLLVGFTDAIGQFNLNRTLGLRRAEVVNQAIQAAVPLGALDDVSLRTLGFGELMPVGCNNTFSGRLVNRRVEVWVRPRTVP